MSHIKVAITWHSERLPMNLRRPVEHRQRIVIWIAWRLNVLVTFQMSIDESCQESLCPTMGWRPYPLRGTVCPRKNKINYTMKRQITWTWKTIREISKMLGIPVTAEPLLLKTSLDAVDQNRRMETCQNHLRTEHSQTIGTPATVNVIQMSYRSQQLLVLRGRRFCTKAQSKKSYFTQSL